MDSYIIESNKKKSRIPARLDFAQSGTGLILGLFMWVHMLLVGSIILGKGSFNFVAKTMELAFLSDTGHGFPIAVFFAVITIFTLFIIHALLGVRKFPISWKQHRIIRDQMQMMNHTDTNLWYIQVVTGFIMFFAGSVHLYVMLTNPGSIDPYLSADRIVSGHMWPLYLILLICVELHGTIGLYRLCMKWGWFAGKDARESRKKLKALKNKLTIFFLSVGILALLVFVVIGINHRDKVGEKYRKHDTAVEQVQPDEQIQVDKQVLADEEIQTEGHEPEEAQSADVTHQ
ncbi:MAG: fumarate reductase cytochrome b subunit [Desulfobacula sp.]|nr:fumarate reductase cytochrome b subunit [Desulfobacula sp.]